MVKWIVLRTKILTKKHETGQKQNKGNAKQLPVKKWLETGEVIFQASSPINCDQLEHELKDHPDKDFVTLLCNSIRNGFDMLISDCKVPTFECKNGLSPRRDPEKINSGWIG